MCSVRVHQGEIPLPRCDRKLILIDGLGFHAASCVSIGASALSKVRTFAFGTDIYLYYSAFSESGKKKSVFFFRLVLFFGKISKPGAVRRGALVFGESLSNTRKGILCARFALLDRRACGTRGNV